MPHQPGRWSVVGASFVGALGVMISMGNHKGCPYMTGRTDSSVGAIRGLPLPRFLRQLVQHRDADLGGVAEQVGVDVLDGVFGGVDT